MAMAVESEALWQRRQPVSDVLGFDLRPFSQAIPSLQMGTGGGVS